MTIRPVAPVRPEDLRAAVAAKTELGDEYEEALTDSLLERFDAQAQHRPSQRTATAISDGMTVVVALGSIGLGVVFALVSG